MVSICAISYKKKTFIQTGPKTELNENDDSPSHQFNYEII